jgi:hypothetical protein
LYFSHHRCEYLSHPLSVAIPYNDCTENIHVELYFHIRVSGTSLNITLLASWSNSNHKSITLLPTVILKVNFREVPSHASARVQPCSLTIV